MQQSAQLALTAVKIEFADPDDIPKVDEIEHGVTDSYLSFSRTEKDGAEHRIFLWVTKRDPEGKEIGVHRKVARYVGPEFAREYIDGFLAHARSEGRTFQASDRKDTHGSVVTVYRLKKAGPKSAASGEESLTPVIDIRSP